MGSEYLLTEVKKTHSTHLYSTHTQLCTYHKSYTKSLFKFLQTPTILKTIDKDQPKQSKAEQC